MKVQTGISIPIKVRDEIDLVANVWQTDRSKAISRIFQEWKRLAKEAGVLPLILDEHPEPNGKG